MYNTEVRNLDLPFILNPSNPVCPSVRLMSVWISLLFQALPMQRHTLKSHYMEKIAIFKLLGECG